MEFLPKDQLLTFWGFSCMLFVAYLLLFLLVWLICVLAFFFFGFILYMFLCASWTWLTTSFPILGKFGYNVFIFFHRNFLFFCDPYNSNIGAFNIVPEVSETVLISFLFILLYIGYFHHSFLQFTYLFFFPSYSAIDSF